MPWHLRPFWGFPWPALVQVPPSDAFVRVSQAFLEVPIAEIPPTVRTTQAFLEVPYSVADQSVRITQAFLEVVYKV